MNTSAPMDRRDAGASKVGSIALGVAAVAGAILFLQSCAGEHAATSATCSAYLTMSAEAQDTTITNLLAAHKLVTSDYANRVGAGSAIASFCVDPANSTRHIDDAVDWSSPYW